MKQLLFTVVAGTIVFFFAVSVLSIGDRTTRTRKLDDTAAEVAECVLSSIMEDPEGAVCDKGELGSAIETMIVERLGEDGDIAVTVTGFDEAKGILSFRVDESFTYPNGRHGRLSTEKTILLEQESMRRLIKVSFILPEIIRDYSSTYTEGHDATYRQYELQSGDRIILPEDPPDIYVPTGIAEGDEYHFTGWTLVREDGDDIAYKNIKPYKAGSSELSYEGIPMGDVVFVAEYEK